MDVVMLGKGGGVFGSRRITFRNCRSATSNPDPTQRSSDRQPSTASRSGRPSPQSKKADHVRVSDESAGGIEDQAAIHLGIEGEVEVVERRVGIAGDGPMGVISSAWRKRVSGLTDTLSLGMKGAKLRFLYFKIWKR